jgi:tetratricopeptide (TPR) repeat protein
MLGDYQGALGDFNKADQLKPNDADTLQRKGETKCMLGDYQGALDDFNKADQLDPNDAVTLQWRLEKQSTNKMIIREHWMISTKLINSIQMMQLLYNGEEKQSTNKMIIREHWMISTKLINSILNDADALQWRGLTKYMLDDYNGALDDLNKADQLEQNDADTLKWRGAVKRLLGDYKEHWMI